MRRKRNGRVTIYLWPSPMVLLAEWRRRQAQCAAELAAARAAGDLLRYREARRRWERLQMRDPNSRRSGS